MPLNPPKPPPTRREVASHKAARHWTIVAFTAAVVTLGVAFGITPAAIVLTACASLGAYYLGGRQGR